jgi:hypothetical protein
LDSRRARRALWAFRLIFYPAAVIGAVLLLTGRSDGQPPVWLDGTTSQGGQMQAQLVDGRVSRLSIDVRMRCPAGIWTITWSPRIEDGRLRLRETTTHRYRFHGQTGRRTITLDAQMEDNTVAGTVTAVEHFVEARYGPYDCTSGCLTFASAS